MMSGCGGGCGCSDCGGGSLLGALMGRLMGVLAAGSRVRVGFPFQISHAISSDEIDALEPQIVSYIQQGLYSYLVDGVTFASARISVNPPGYFSDGYITVEATTAADLPTANVFGDMVQYGINTYLPKIYTTRRDETLIDYAAPGRVNQQGVEQAGPPRVCSWDTMDLQDYVNCNLGIGKWGSSDGAPPPGSTGSPNVPTAPGECQWSSMSFGDYVACQLGIKSAIGGVAAGATGALIGVGLVAVVGLVLLKKVV